MGQKGSKGLTKQQKELLDAEKKTDQAIKLKLAKDHATDKAIYKLLLLGAGESGKSTLFKQISCIYGSGASREDLIAGKSLIVQNMIQALYDLISHCPDYQVEIAPENNASRDFFLRVDTSATKWTPEMVTHARILWADQAIQHIWQYHTEIDVPESSRYFYDRLDSMADPAYIPTQTDYLHLRVRTTGIVQKQFEIDNNIFHLFDVGGQRNERKKWLHAFDSVTAVIFVAAISEYDQTLFEDHSVNRLEEAIQLFDEQINSKWFVNTSMLLFLNKSDLFREKIARVPIRDYFPSYSGEENDFEQIKLWILKQFTSKNKNKNKVIYQHVTCATDTDNVRLVFTAVKDILIRDTLSEAGLN